MAKIRDHFHVLGTITVSAFSYIVTYTHNKVIIYTFVYHYILVLLFMDKVRLRCSNILRTFDSKPKSWAHLSDDVVECQLYIFINNEFKINRLTILFAWQNIQGRFERNMPQSLAASHLGFHTRCLLLLHAFFSLYFHFFLNIFGHKS